MLKWNKVNFSFQSKEIFNQVNLNLDDKKNYCVLGVNGAGKSTFLKLASGILKPERGKIEIGFDSFSYVPAHNELHPCLKVLDLIDMFLHKPKRFSETKEYKLLDIEKIPKENYLSNISSGQRQRLLLALSLVKDCPIRFFDEPLNHLDLYYQNQFFKALNLSKTMNFLVLHQIDSSLKLEDAKVLLVKEQDILDLGPPHIALTHKELEKTFYIRAQITDNPIDGHKLLAYSNYESE